MRIGRTIILPAIIALGIAGSSLATSAITVTAEHAATVPAHTAQPYLYYHS
jgi:hypothetical protein